MRPIFKLGVAGVFEESNRALRELKHKMMAQGKLVPHLAGPHPNVTMGDRARAVGDVFKDAWTGLKAGHARNMADLGQLGGHLKKLWRRR